MNIDFLIFIQFTHHQKRHVVLDVLLSLVVHLVHVLCGAIVTETVLLENGAAPMGVAIPADE